MKRERAHLVSALAFCASYFLVACLLCAAGCEKRELPDILEIAAPVGSPGAIAWDDGKFISYGLEDNRVYISKFSAKNRKFVRESFRGRTLCVEAEDGFNLWAGRCFPPADIARIGSRFLALGPMNLASFEPYNPDDHSTHPAGDSPAGAYAFAESDNSLFFLGNSVLWQKTADGNFNQIPLDIPPTVGLVVRDGALYTVVRGTGQIIKLTPVNNQGNEWTITDSTPPIAHMPYGLAYSKKDDSFWVSSPSFSKVYRVLPLTFKPVMTLEENPSSEIADDTTWGANGRVLDITQRIKVNKGATLTIAPGASIKFAPGAGLVIEGSLVAEGDVEKRIVLQAANPEAWWQGIQVAPGGGARLKFVEISFAKTGVKAQDPALLDISQSYIHQISWDGVNLAVSSQWPKISFNNNKLEEIGGVGLDIALPQNAAPPDEPLVVSNNTFLHSTSGVSIGPVTTRPLKERVEEATPPPFAFEKPLVVRIEQNGFFQNLEAAVRVSGDGLGYPVKPVISENAIEDIYRGYGIEILESSAPEVRQNAVVNAHVAILIENAAVNLRPGAPDLKVFVLAGNLFKDMLFCIYGLTFAQTHDIERNSMFAAASTYYLNKYGMQMRNDKIRQVKIISEGNLWKPEPRPIVNSSGALEPPVSEAALKGDSTVPLNKAVLDCLVVKGTQRLAAPDVKIEIRDTLGNPVRQATSNAAGRFVVALNPGDYFVRASGAIQWSRITASPTDINACELSAP